jgi:hypothetical protein
MNEYVSALLTALSAGQRLSLRGSLGFAAAGQKILPARAYLAQDLSNNLRGSSQLALKP